MKKIRPFGNQTPWGWGIEPVHGCNLRCGHCSTRLYEPGVRQYMTKETWINTFEVVKEVSPTCRIDLCVAGEPTLHPDLPKFLEIAREISPLSQIQITTNGTQLAQGLVTYDQLFTAGANFIYVDMYAPQEFHIQLAKNSGYPYYEYYKLALKDEKRLSPWTYHGNPDIKQMVLQEQPDNWPKSRYRAGLLGTWYNHLDWEAAAKYGLKPVTQPLTRRCNQPFVYVPVHYSGNYLLCCQDNWGETAGLFGNVSEGVEEFKKYWFGKDMQIIRGRLHNKNRADTSYCSRCCITFSRCDLKYRTEEELKVYYDGDWKRFDTPFNTNMSWETAISRLQ